MRIILLSISVLLNSIAIIVLDYALYKQAKYIQKLEEKIIEKS